MSVISIIIYHDLPLLSKVVQQESGISVVK